MGRWRRLVYFARRADGTGPIKIGASACPVGRVKQLGFDHATEIEVIAEVAGDLGAERQLHRQFAYCRAVVPTSRLRRTGRVSIIPGAREWYNPVPELLELIDDLKSGRRVLSQYDARDADMARRRLAGETLQNIGTSHGVTRERVRQILARMGITGKSRCDLRRAA